MRVFPLSRPIAAFVRGTVIAQSSPGRPAEAAIGREWMMSRYERARSSWVRARRYAMHLPVWYRGVGTDEWHGGVTENIGVSGMLIRADGMVVPAASVTVIISLPSTADECGACLVGRGRVARIATSPRQTTPPVFAVDVVRYRLHRRQSAADTTIR
jgi:hypothetical protein